MKAARQSGRIKGTGLVNLVKALRADRERAVAALPPELRHYVESKSRVWPSEWYSEDDLMGLLRTAATLAPDSVIDAWEWLGRQSARIDFAGTYASLVKPGNPAVTLGRYPTIWRLYHDAGVASVEPTGEDRATVEIDHYLTTFDDFCRLMTGHLAELLLIGGAAESEVRTVRVADAEGPARWQARWSLAPG